MRAMVLFVALLSGCHGFNPSLGGGYRDTGYTADASARSSSEPVWTPSQFVWQQIGYSTEMRPLQVTRIGRGPRRVLWIGGIHGNEQEGRIATEELPGAFLSIPGAAEDVTLIVLEDINPDGSAKVTRGNANGVDLNRNYPAANYKAGRSFGKQPLDQPEARVLHDLILREDLDLVIVAHSWRGDQFVNYDGPARHLAERFSELSGYRVKESDQIHPTPGSLGSWVGLTLKIPILTLEYRRGSDARAAWNKTKQAILAVIRSG